MLCLPQSTFVNGVLEGLWLIKSEEKRRAPCEGELVHAWEIVCKAVVGTMTPEMRAVFAGVAGDESILHRAASPLVRRGPYADPASRANTLRRQALALCTA